MRKIPSWQNQDNFFLFQLGLIFRQGHEGVGTSRIHLLLEDSARWHWNEPFVQFTLPTPRVFQADMYSKTNKRSAHRATDTFWSLTN